MTDDIIPIEEARRGKAEETKVGPDAAVAETKDETIARLRHLDPIEYDQARPAAAETLDIRMSTLDKMVAQARGDDGDDDSDLTLPDPEPWPEAVDGDALLDDIVAAARRYLVLPSGAAEVAALWAIHAHAFNCFQITPRLHIRSPEKGCGHAKAEAVRELAGGTGDGDFDRWLHLTPFAIGGCGPRRGCCCLPL